MLQLNDEFVFRSGDSHYSKNKVVEFVPNKKVVWLVTESKRKTDNFEWTGTKIIFELAGHISISFSSGGRNFFEHHNNFLIFEQIMNFGCHVGFFQLPHPPSAIVVRVIGNQFATVRS